MSSSSVTVIHGICRSEFEEIVGRTVKQVQDYLSIAFNVGKNSFAFIDGNRVSLDYELNPGETLEFVYPFGKKGRNPVHTLESIKLEYKLPDFLCNQLVKDIPSIGTNDEGLPLYAEQLIDEWINRRSGRNDRATIEGIAVDIRRMADQLAPTPSDIVGTPYLSGKLGCTTAWITKLIRAGQIPLSCIVEGTGNGKLWKFHRQKIDRWIEER